MAENEQDIKILNQLFSHLASNQTGTNSIPITIIQKVEITNEARKFDFFEFLQSLPEPRMESLKDEAIKVTVERLGSKISAGRFLSLCERSVRTRTNERKPKELELKVVGGNQYE